MTVVFAILNTLVGLAAAVLFVLCAFFFLQVVLGRRRTTWTTVDGSARTGPRPTVAVLIPAHNEGSGITATLECVRAQLLPTDRLLVVADNCSDDTALVAGRHGAEVVVRHDTTLRGKGYALDFGYRHLLTRPFDVLLIVDADCLLSDHAVDTLAREACQSGHPIQGLYLMLGSPTDGTKQRIAEFAWRIRNWARPAGMGVLGLPCQLMGTGMAFPARALDGLSFATGHIVEDLQLGLQLAAAGKAPLFCERALVTSEFPRDEAARQAQRARWEHGHLSMIFGGLPSFLLAWLRKPTLQALALFMDAAIPPLTLLLLLALATTVLAGGLRLAGGSPAPLQAMSVTLACLLVGLAVGWTRYGRDLVGRREAVGAVGYLFWKIPLFLRFVTKRQTEWVRSKRESEHD